MNREEIISLKQENERLRAEYKALSDRLDQSQQLSDRYYCRELLSLLPVAYIETDLGMKVTYINKAAETISGYRQADILKGLGLKDMIPPGINLDENFRKGLEGKPKEFIPYKLLRKDGSETSCLVVSLPRKKGKEVTGLGIIVSDISARLQAAHELEESEQKFRHFAQLLPQTVFEIDLEGNLLFLNDYSYQMFGYNKDDQIGNAFSMMAPEDLPRISENLKKILHGIPNNGTEYVAIKKDGTRMPVIEYSVPVYKEGKPVGFRGILVNITERKNIEKALFESEEKYRTLTDQLPLGVYRSTFDGWFIFGNRMLARILGYSSMEELMKVPLKNLYINPSLRRSFLKKPRSLLRARTAEFSVRRKDGTIIWVRDTFRVHLNENGKVAYMDGILEDFTEKKLLQDKLKQWQRLQAMGTLAGGIAHDFNNLLMAMQLYTELALKNIPPRSVGAENLAKVASAQNKAKLLIEQILTFSRSDSGKTEKLDLKTAVGEVLEQIANSIPEGTELKVQLKESGTIEMGSLHLERILINLCSNAVHSMDGKGLLEIRLQPAQVKDPVMKLRPAGKGRRWVKLVVKDNGQGMETHIKERIFDPFFTTKKVNEGTGLGLTIVHNIVDQCGGEIFVQSSPGRGTSFSVFLPARIKRNRPSKE